MFLSAGCSSRPATGQATPTVPPALTTASVTATPGASVSPSPSTPASRTPAAAGTTGPATYQAAAALDHVRQLATTIGPRVAGSPGEARAVDYIGDQLAGDGYTVETIPFSYDGDRFRPATITIAGRDLEALTMGGSAGGSVTASAVFVGLADAAGIAGQDLSGKIAVTDRGVLRFGDKAANARAAGAAAVVIINNEDVPFLGNLARYLDVPVVGARQVDGDALRKAARAGNTITIVAPAADQSQSLDVVARPAAGGRCDVLVGGHHDSVPGAPGAHDNASGSATVLELARAFAADGLDAGLCFATFGAEESGLFGSKALVDRLTEQGALPRYMVNLDMTGEGDKIDLIGTPAVTARALAAAEGLGIPAEVVELGQQYGSDHQSFEQAGVPVILITTNELGRFHTPQDTADRIEQPALQRTGDVAYALIKELLAQVARGGRPS